MSTTNTSPFLRIPTELRLQIYSYALLDTPVITIGTAELVGSHSDIVYRLYGNTRTPHSGVPLHHEPVITPQYDESLLSITQPAVIPLPPLVPAPLERNELYSSLQNSPHHALLYVCKQVYQELVRHFSISKNRRTSLFVSFPHGLHILKTLTPGLLRQCRSLHLAGIYTSRTFNASRGAAVGIPAWDQKGPLDHGDKRVYNGNIIPDSAASLSQLITTLFGPTPIHQIQILQLRIYYPGQDSYTTVWGDDDSPTVIALRSIYAGEIAIEVWRGRNGTGVFLSATRPGLLADADGRREGERKRVVSTVWRRLEEGRRNEPRDGSWVVDDRWPDWTGEEGQGSENRDSGEMDRSGATVVTTTGI